MISNETLEAWMIIAKSDSAAWNLILRAIPAIAREAGPDQPIHKVVKAAWCKYLSAFVSDSVSVSTAEGGPTPTSTPFATLPKIYRKWACRYGGFGRRPGRYCSTLEGRLHSFDDLPAYICVSDSTAIMFVWMNRGVVDRKNKPAIVIIQAVDYFGHRGLRVAAIKMWFRNGQLVQRPPEHNYCITASTSASELRYYTIVKYCRRDAVKIVNLITGRHRRGEVYQYNSSKLVMKRARALEDDPVDGLNDLKNRPDMLTEMEFRSVARSPRNSSQYFDLLTGVTKIIDEPADVAGAAVDDWIAAVRGFLFFLGK